MSKVILRGCIVILLWALTVCAQGTTPSDEEVAANKRLQELLRKPTFITLRLLSDPPGLSRERPSDTPPLYTVGDRINFQLLVSQSLSEAILTWNRKDPYYEYQPELYRDGDIVACRKDAQERVERILETLYDTRGQSVSLAPGREYFWASVNPEDWYEPLGPGHYQLTVRKRFVWDGDWVQSNPVTFDVRPRNPVPIPDTVTVEMIPSGFQGKAEEKPYRVAKEGYMKVVVWNHSDLRIRVIVVDTYYQNRPKLFKDGRLLPYREEIKKLVWAKDKDPEFIRLGSIRFLEPNTSTDLEELNLSDWYGSLEAGSYRLTNRYRFDVDGRWTAESAEVLFEVVRQQ